jgi:hypothetical protein
MHLHLMTGIEKLRVQPLGVVIGSLIVVGGALLPWGGSGRVDRSSFDIVRVAGRNQLLPDGLAGPARIWLLAPVALALVLVAAAYRRRALAVGVAVGLAAVGTVLVVAVWRSPMQPRFGLAVSLGGALLTAGDAMRHAVRRTAADKEHAR